VSRLDRRQRIGEDPAKQALELAVCERDILHWVNAWVWTYDPREPVTMLPFDLFPKQAEFLGWIREREKAQEDGLVEKGRDVGASWLCCAYALHGWLFRKGYQVGFGSRKLEYVDEKGDPKSIFEKIRLMLEYMPGWMFPPGWRWQDHSCHAKLINPANGATITGEGGDNIGRGGRASIYFVDEAAYLERPQMVDRALSQTTRCRIDVSTPNGPGNPFAIKRHGGRVKVFTLHWRDDPRKDEEWFRYQKEVKYASDPAGLAQEVEIDYTASIEGVTIPAAWVRAAVDVQLPATGKNIGGFDVADEGRNRNVLISRRGPVVRPPADWAQGNTTESAWRARDEAQRLGLDVVCYDCIGVGAGIKGTWNTSERPLGFIPVAISTGDTPSDAHWPDGRSSKEKFVNLRAELWWKLRVRFEKTYEYKTRGVRHRPEEMISIPNHPQLIAELSLPTHRQTDTGKIKIESKDEMRRRGVKSPDFADALVLCFARNDASYEMTASKPAAAAPRGVFNDPEVGRYGGGRDPDW